MKLLNIFKKNKNERNTEAVLPPVPNKLNNLSAEEDDFAERKIEIARFQEYMDKTKPITDEYFHLLEKIEADWSVMYNMHSYQGKIAKALENDCKRSIDLYKKWHQIDLEYGEDTPSNVPCYRRLAMLYERQGKYEESINICKETIKARVNISDARPRLVRMINKAKRQPTSEEMELIESDDI